MSRKYNKNTRHTIDTKNGKRDIAKFGAGDAFYISKFISTLSILQSSTEETAF